MKAPARWLEESEDLPEEWVAGMRAYQDVGPSEAELAQVRVGLRLRRGGGAAGTLKGLALISVLAGVGAFSWLSHETKPERERPAAPAPAAVAPAVVSPEVVAPAITETPVESEAAAPSVAPMARKPRRAAALDARDPVAELALLRRARRALPATPATSLALLAEHQRTYPRGVFAEERELIAIEALAHTDRAAAVARARAFSAAYPRSVHAARIQVLLADR